VLKSETSTVVIKTLMETRIASCGKESKHILHYAGIDARFECLSSPLVRLS
jgi:hypothetical protein